MKCNGQNPRLVNKNNNENERRFFENIWTEATQLYGTSISYYTNLYSLTSHDFIYGENPTKGFSAPVPMLAIAQMNNDSLLLSKFGIQTDSDLTLVVPIKAFSEYFEDGHYHEPKSGDLLVLDELGWDRPAGGGYPNSYPTTQQTGLSTSNICKLLNPEANYTTSNEFLSGNGYNPMTNWMRGANVYEITERRDDNIPQQINPLQAHIVWLIKCKRFDYSYEPDAPREIGSDQISDNTLYGKLSGGTATPEPAKKYTQNADDESKKTWDYLNTGNRSGVYGDY